MTLDFYGAMLTFICIAGILVGSFPNAFTLI